MRATKHAPRGPLRVLERRYGLAEIVERGAVVHENRLRVSPPHLERELIILTENAPRHGRHFAEQCPGFFEAFQIKKGIRVVIGCYEGLLIFLAFDLQNSGVYVSKRI